MADLIEKMRGVKDAIGQPVQRRWRDLGNNLFAEQVAVTDDWQIAKGQGRAWISGAAVTVPTLGGAGAAFRIANPVNSGLKVVVAKLTMYSSIEQQVQYREGATLPAPTAITPRNFLIGAQYPAPTIEVQWDDSVSTDGILWDNRSRVHPQAPLDLSIGVVLLEGNSLVVQGESSSAHTATVNGYIIVGPA